LVFASDAAESNVSVLNYLKLPGQVVIIVNFQVLFGYDTWRFHCSLHWFVFRG